jgi:hypothetical protein
VSGLAVSLPFLLGASALAGACVRDALTDRRERRSGRADTPDVSVPQRRWDDPPLTPAERELLQTHPALTAVGRGTRTDLGASR